MMRPETTLPPFDPADADRIEPADLHLCPSCEGDGCIEVIVEGAVIDRDCRACEGTGVVEPLVGRVHGMGGSA